MFWFARPPYGRRAAAVFVLVAAAWIELAGDATVDHPFAIEEIPAGATIEASMLEQRAVPAGEIPTPDPSLTVAARRIGQGEPLVPSALTGGSPVPPDWWSVPVPLPAEALPGTQVRLVLADPPRSVDGVIVAVGEASAFADREPGLIAVPPDAAQAVAVAVAQDGVVVLLAP